MSLSVKSINADSSFLLSFTPASDQTADGSFCRTYHILVDPWLTGASTVLSRRFAHTLHTSKACVNSLGELPRPDMVLVSQDMPDHCHKDTLMQLPTDTSTTIVAPSSAAKRIQSWGRFTPSSICPLARYDSRRPETVLRIPVPADGHGYDGEVTVAYIAPRFDPKGLHNAIGLTFRPPSSFLNGRGKTCSILYSPHGVDCKYAMSYARTHLLLEGAMPLDVLLHSMDRVSAPWYLGGVICSGSTGGISLASGLQAKHWISAHDEEKVVTGISSRSLTVQKHDSLLLASDLQEQLALAVLESGSEKSALAMATLHTLDAGEDVTLQS